jgi:hypothetical protein
LAASRVARCLLYAHNGATRALLAAKIASVKCVIINDLWYEPEPSWQVFPLAGRAER